MYYTIKAVCEDICCGQEKACKLMAELESADLIERHRRGQGKPSRIYVKQFSAEVGKSKQFSFEAPTPLNSEVPAEELGESKINHTENKQTEMIYTNPSSSAKRMEEVRDQLDYPLILEHLHGNNATVDAIVSVIVEAMGSEAATLRVGGRDVPKAEVVSVLEQLDFTHVEYVMDCMKESRPDIKNIRAFLLTALYNAPATAEAYYDARVAHGHGLVVQRSLCILRRLLRALILL